MSDKEAIVMRPLRRRRRANRVPRFESVEPRIYLSGDPVADFCLDYFVENQLSDEIYTSLADAHDLTGLSQARVDYGFTGSGQTVAVIDSGIAYDHLALGGGLGSGYRVVGGFDFTGEWDADPYDDGPWGSHGTHVSGIIASSHSNSIGVAPEVDLVGLRVFDDDGSGYFHWVEDALQWVHTNRNAFENPITTVNLSLGTNWNADSLPSWAMLENEFAQLHADGIFVSVAAGNSFTSFNEAGLSYPAVSPYVVPVASVDDGGNLSYFSQRNQRVIAAPGRGILSSVPDYVGNHNGTNDDFARYSGTSMASPYVAGASVLLRQAYEFVGLTNVAQETIYNLMVSTADTIYDSSTAQSYHRLNLGRAIDTIMPADDFGSNQSTAHSLGTITDTHSLSGTISTLQDHDWFTFTAGETGSLTIEIAATGDLLPEWQPSAAINVHNAPGGISFDVIAGQTYTFGLTTNDGLGHYTLDFDLDSAISYIDWGTVLQDDFHGNQIDADGQWFTVTAAADGILTTEAFFSNANGDVDLQLFDAHGQLLGTSAGMSDSERIDVTASAGEVFYLHVFTYAGGTNEQVDFRVTNLVSHSGNTVHVSGTAGDDNFVFAAGSIHQVSINGVAYQFDSAVVGAVTFDGLAGSDTAALTGTGGDDYAVLRAGSAELTGSGYSFQATNVETVTVWGGGGADRVVLYDSAGDDSFVAAVGYGGMFGQGFSNQAIGFEMVEAHASTGGFDVARFYDSPGNDTFVAAPTRVVMFGDGFYNQAEGFHAVHAYATAGGLDIAKLYDSTGDDTFAASSIDGALFGDGFYNRAKFFEQVHAYATAAGNDVAWLYDSAGDDVFVSTSVDGALFGDGFYNRAKFFEQVHTDGNAGGNDQAYLFDSAGDEHLQASESRASLLSDTSSTWLYGFEYVRAEAIKGGSNTTELAAVDYILELDGDWS
jgi:hypothetical protein